MAVNVGEAFVTIRPETGNFAREAQSKITAPLNAAFAGISTAVVGQKIGQFFRSAFDEATEASKVLKQTEAVLKSTGGAAGVTADHIGDLAGNLSDLAAIDDEVIQQGENVLLTFTKVRNEVGKGNNIFDQATKAALNMSAALGTDFQGAVIQVGKALNDPIAGLTSLTRAGVQFTDQQKEQIRVLVESGNTLGAQKIILGELQTQFGGAAASQATDAQKLSVAFGNLKEAIGTALLPVINGLAQALTPLAEFLSKNQIAAAALAVVISGALLAGMVAYTIRAVAATAATLGFAESEVAATTAASGLGAAMLPWVGAAALAVGTYIGLKQAISGSTVSLSADTKEVLRSTEAHLKAATAAAIQIEGWNKFRETFKRTAEESLPAAQKILNSADLTGKQRQILIDIIDKEEAAQRRAAAAATQGAGALDDQTDSATDTKDALQELNDYINASFDANLQLEEAQLRVDQALQTLNETLGQYAADTLEGRGATLDAKAAIEAYGQQAKDTASLVTSSSQEQAQAQVDALSRVAAQLAPDSPLRVWLDEYIAALRYGIEREIESRIVLTLTNNTGMTQSELDSFIFQTAAMGVGLPPEFAGGGIVPGPLGSPTLAIVHGGEQIYDPLHPDPAMLPGGAGVTVNMYGSMDTDPVRYAYLTGRTLLAYMSAAGR